MYAVYIMYEFTSICHTHTHTVKAKLNLFSLKTMAIENYCFLTRYVLIHTFDVDYDVTEYC